MKRAECRHQRTAVFRSSRWVVRQRVRDRGAVDVIAVGRARASAASRCATRGTAYPAAPTAERSRLVRSSTRTNLDLWPEERYLFAGTQRRLRRHRRALGLTMRPLRGRPAQPRRPRSGHIGFAARAVRISIFGQERDASLPGNNIACVATGAHWDGQCDRSAVGPTRRAVPRVARLLAALAARDPRLLYRPLRGRGPVRLSEGQTRSISTLTENTVAPALQNDPRTRNAARFILGGAPQARGELLRTPQRFLGEIGVAQARSRS